MYGELKDLVPKQFAPVSPTSTHTFAIISPECHIAGNVGWRAARHADHTASCKLRHANRLIPIMIPLKTEPYLGKAIVALSNLPRNGYRPAKYLDLYMILEDLGSMPREDHRALRHALAHAPRALTRTATLNRLQILFGSKHIDLGNNKHECVFWRLFGELLVDIEVFLGKQLKDRLSEFAVSDGKEAMFQHLASGDCSYPRVS